MRAEVDGRIEAVLRQHTHPAAADLTFFVAAANGSDTSNDGRSPSSPFATLHRARDAIRLGRDANCQSPGLGAAQPATIYLLPGTHRLETTLDLGPPDGALLIAAYKPQASEPTTLSGAAVLGSSSAWQHTGGCMFQLPLNQPPRNPAFQTLFVNGRRAIR